MKVPCLYQDEVAVLFATGPSLTKEQVELVRPYHASGKVRAFGCNDSYKIVDYLDVHYACDSAWWDVHETAPLEALAPTAHIWTQCAKSATRLRINHIKGSYTRGLYIKSNDHIHFGHNSGFQLLNLAYHYGIRKFILLGYNMGLVRGQYHYFGKHPGKLQKTSAFDKFITSFNELQPEIKEMVVNCTSESALTCFRLGNLEQELINL